MATFEVIDRITTWVPRTERRVVLRTDDWIEAEEAASVKHWRNKDAPLRIIGIHPTHVIGTVTRLDLPQSFEGCTVCRAPNNGCFAIHAPCGFVFDKAMVTIIEEWEKSRAEG